jgi:hypothetical protein
LELLHYHFKYLTTGWTQEFVGGCPDMTEDTAVFVHGAAFDEEVVRVMRNI